MGFANANDTDGKARDVAEREYFTNGFRTFIPWLLNFLRFRTPNSEIRALVRLQTLARLRQALELREAFGVRRVLPPLFGCHFL